MNLNIGTTFLLAKKFTLTASTVNSASRPVGDKKYQLNNLIKSQNFYNPNTTGTIRNRATG